MLFASSRSPVVRLDALSASTQIFFHFLRRASASILETLSEMWVFDSS
jgi:hypothetical protein